MEDQKCEFRKIGVLREPRRWDNDVDQMSDARKTHHGVLRGCPSPTAAWVSRNRRCRAVLTTHQRPQLQSSTGTYWSPPQCSLLSVTFVRQSLLLHWSLVRVGHKKNSKNREWGKSRYCVFLCPIYTARIGFGEGSLFWDFAPFLNLVKCDHWPLFRTLYWIRGSTFSARFWLSGMRKIPSIYLRSILSGYP